MHTYTRIHMHEYDGIQRPIQAREGMYILLCFCVMHTHMSMCIHTYMHECDITFIMVSEVAKGTLRFMVSCMCLYLYVHAPFDPKNVPFDEKQLLHLMTKNDPFDVPFDDKIFSV